MRQLRNGKNAEAMEIFTYNQRQHPEEKFWTYLRLARGYTARGDRKNAVTSWEIVQRNIPSNLNSRTSDYQEALRKLKENT